MTATTCPAVQKLTESIQQDLTQAIGHLTRGLEIVRALEGVMGDTNGLSEFLKAQGNALKKLEEVHGEVTCSPLTLR